MGDSHEVAFPVLVAEHTDDAARDMLRAVARGRGILVVQLRAAPLAEGRHVLEVSAPGKAVERFFAEPVAAPCDWGFPLRLEPYLEPQDRSVGLSVPELSFDTLPPRRTDNPASYEGQPAVPGLSTESLGGWLLSGSGTMQSAADRAIDAAWLAELHAMGDVDSFKAEVIGLLPAVGKALRDGDAATLSTVITTMRAIVKNEDGKGRAKYAGRVLRFMRDPSRLVPFVDEALAGPSDPAGPLQHVLVETQAAAAEALCAGRLRHVTPVARARFVALVLAIGPAAMPSLSTALRGCLERGERRGDLVEDLLRAMPATADETAGAVIAELLRGGPVASTTSAALSVLPIVWGDRARPLVLAGLAHPDARVVLVALQGVRRLRAIDAGVIRRLDAIVTGAAPASEELRVAAAAALADALPEARADAGTLAVRAFAAARSTSASSSGAFTVALARTLIALGVPNAAALIEERAARSPEDVRSWLTSLVRR